MSNITDDSHLLAMGLHGMGSCAGRWTPLNHVLFQLAHACILISYVAPAGVYGVLFLHSSLIVGFILLTVWAWVIMCGPDILSWNFMFAIINSIQVVFILYRLKPIKFHPDIEILYTKLFRPLNVPRFLFKKLVTHEICSVHHLAVGQHYSTQGVTLTSGLALLISGEVSYLHRFYTVSIRVGSNAIVAHLIVVASGCVTAAASCDGQLLHAIAPMQFLDSAEFECSSSEDEDKFHVSVQASAPCRYAYWQKAALERLFSKEPYLATVVGIIISRDVTDKLTLLSQKVHQLHGSRSRDIRLSRKRGASLSMCGEAESPAWLTKPPLNTNFGSSNDNQRTEDDAPEADEKTRLYGEDSTAV